MHDNQRFMRLTNDFAFTKTLADKEYPERLEDLLNAVLGYSVKSPGAKERRELQQVETCYHDRYSQS